MAFLNPTDLAKLLESVSVTNDGFAAEKALTNLLGFEIPLDASVESAADAIAEKLGLQPKNSTIQTGVFVLTKAAILETASLVGLGSGLAKLDLSFKMAQLAKQVEAIDKKLDVILSAPLKLAVDFFVKAMCRLENENISGTIEDITKVRDHAMQAFRYAEGQGPKIEHLKSSVLAKSLTIVAEILLESNNNQTILPFSLLDERKKRTIASLIEIEVTSLQRFHDSHTISMFTMNKAEKAKQKQDLIDGLLRSAYPFISEGKALTNSSAKLELPCHIKVLPMYLPDGEEDAVFLDIGQYKGFPLKVAIWKDGDQVVSYGTQVKITGEEEVTLHVKGSVQQDKKWIDRTCDQIFFC